MKPLEQYFHLVLFTSYEVLTFDSEWNPEIIVTTEVKSLQQ